MPGNEPHVTIEDPWAAIPEALIYDPTISHLALRVYGCLRRHGADPRNCFPSYERVGELLGVSERSIQKPVKELAAAGWITVEARFRDDGGRKSNAYVIHSRARTEAQGGTASLQRGGYALPQRAEGEQEEREQEPRERRADPLPLGDSFETFWLRYPKCANKGAKERARREWQKHARDVEAVMAGLERWVAYWEARGEPEFICAAGKWLAEERWVDGPPPLRLDQRRSGTVSYEDQPVRYS